MPNREFGSRWTLPYELSQDHVVTSLGQLLTVYVTLLAICH